MGYLTQRELEQLHLKHLGKRVMVSSLARIYAPHLVELEDDCRIDDFCVLTGRVRLGKYVHLALYTHISGMDHGVVFADFSECAYRCTVIAHSSDYSLSTLHSPCVPKEYCKGREGKVVIGRHCLIGCGTLIMPNVTIAEGCSFGAFSYVCQDTEPWGLYDGRPAVRVRENSRGCLEYERLMTSGNQCNMSGGKHGF